MMRLNLALLLTLLASALYLVHSHFEARRLFIEHERARALAHKLEVEFDRLQIERRTQATPSRVERLARQQLLMRPATPAITHYVPAPARTP